MPCSRAKRSTSFGSTSHPRRVLAPLSLRFSSSHLMPCGVLPRALAVSPVVSQFSNSLIPGKYASLCTTRSENIISHYLRQVKSCEIISVSNKDGPGGAVTPRGPAHKELLMDTTSVAYVLCRIEDDGSVTPVSEHEDIVAAVIAGKHQVEVEDFDFSYGVYANGRRVICFAEGRIGYREWARRNGRLGDIHSLDDRYDHDVDELMA